MEVFAGFLIIFLLARLLGVAAERLGQSAAVGELLSGILLAAIAVQFVTTFPFVDNLIANEIMAPAASLGIFFLVLRAGVELEPEEIRQNSLGALAVALGGMLIPLIAGIGLAWLFLPATDQRQAQALLIGVAMSISAIPATVKILSDSGLLHTRMGETIVAAAIFDDILGLILLAILLAVIQTGHIPDWQTLALMLGKVTLFFAVTITLGVHVYPHVRRGLRFLQATATEFSALIAVALTYGLLAEALGVHWILGAFMAGLYCEASRIGHKAHAGMKVILTAVTSGFLGPVFFASIGLQVDLAVVAAVPLFLTALIAAAFLGKLIGAGLPALAIGLDRREAAAVGVGMSARGAVEMVVLGIALEAGVFSTPGNSEAIVTHLFSALVLMAVMTTFLAPIILRQIIPKDRSGASARN